MSITMTQAQTAWDNRAEPECSDEQSELLDWATELTEAINDAYATIGRAERAVALGQLDAARDLLQGVANKLEAA